MTEEPEIRNGDESRGRRSASQLIIDGATAWGAAAGGTGTLLLGAAAAKHVFGNARQQRRARIRADAFDGADAANGNGLGSGGALAGGGQALSRRVSIRAGS